MPGSSSSTNRTAALWLLSKNKKSHLPLVEVLEVGSMPSNRLVAMILSLREDAWGGDTGLSNTVKEMPRTAADLSSCIMEWCRIYQLATVAFSEANHCMGMYIPKQSVLELDSVVMEAFT